MGATVHDGAPNTYYGHWPRFFAKKIKERMAFQ
jgi:hypothetical protein